MLKHRAIRVVIATAVATTLLGAMAETLTFVIYRLDEWIDE